MTSTFRNLLISVILISFPIQFVCAKEELTEEKSLSILIAQIKKDKLYDSFSQNLKCISFHTEEQTKEYFALHYVKNMVANVKVIQTQRQLLIVTE